MEKSETETLKEIPIRRRGPLRSRTVDTLLHILSICYADSSHIIQDSDKGDIDIQSVTKDDSLHREEMFVDERRVVLFECDHNKDVKNQDNYDMMISSPHLTTNKDVEEGEISGEFMDLMPEDDTSSMDKIGSEPENYLGIELELENDNNLIPVDDMVAVVSKTRRNLVDYSEIAVQGRCESVPVRPENEPPLRSILKNSATKNQDLASLVKDATAQNSKKRQGSPTEEKITNKKAKKSDDLITCPENLGEQSEDASQEVVDDSANKDDASEKKKKRVLTKERKAKKKKKDRIKRAEKNRKLGVKRLKLQTVIKEKKITYCRHYLKGRCHEGENCKFSHDTIPLTKSKPCCHFARHTCMKGDDCPFDHQLSKYPCNNYLSKGFCSRGSDCMFSHEAQASETSLNAPDELKPEPKSSSLLDNSSSKKQNNIGISSREKLDMKSFSTPVSSIISTKQNLVETTPKLSARPPKGISFLSSQEKFPLETCSSPKVHSEIQDSSEMTKTPPVAPRGVNFLSFGTRPGLNNSNGGFSFKMGIGKSPLSNLEGGVKNDQNTLHNDDKQVNSDLLGNKPDSSRKSMLMPMLPFMSSSLQKALQSTLDFASKFESGVKKSRPENLTQKL